MSSKATSVQLATQCATCGKPMPSGARFCSECAAAAGSGERPTIDSSTQAADDLYCKAMALSLTENSGIPAMPLLQEALGLGLAPKDEANARLMLGEAYREIVGNSGQPWLKMVEANEFRQGILEIEKAVEVDRTGSLGFFMETLNIGRLKNLDHMYTLTALAQEEQEGSEAAVAYLASKLRAVEYLPRPPLLLSLLKLAELYRDTSRTDDSLKCLRRVIDTEPLYPADQEWNDELRGKAVQMLAEIQGTTANTVGSLIVAGHCTHCGNPLSSGAHFCIKCGFPGDTDKSLSAAAQNEVGRPREAQAARVHLLRAHRLITEAGSATEEFRASALAHKERLDNDQPFLQMIITGIKGNRQLESLKSKLVADLQLAQREIDQGAALDPDATLETDDGALGIKALRAMMWYTNGQLELLWGSSQKAKELFTNTIELVDLAEAHYMLGLIYEEEYKPAEALEHFEKCLSSDPAGDLSVPALREASAMRNYKKKFRGSWVLLIFLSCYIVPGIFYWRAKYK